MCQRHYPFHVTKIDHRQFNECNELTCEKQSLDGIATSSSNSA